MSKAEARQLVEYMRKIQRRMGLNEWRISLEIYEQTELPSRLWLEGEAGIGYMSSWHEQRSATLHVVAYPRDLTIRQIIRHEVAHLLLEPMWRVVKRVEKPLGSTAWEIISEAYREAEEIAVNRIMRAMS